MSSFTVFCFGVFTGAVFVIAAVFYGTHPDARAALFNRVRGLFQKKEG
jgi:hypothetical protein